MSFSDSRVATNRKKNTKNIAIERKRDDVKTGISPNSFILLFFFSETRWTKFDKSDWIRWALFVLGLDAAITTRISMQLIMNNDWLRCSAHTNEWEAPAAGSEKLRESDYTNGAHLALILQPTVEIILFHLLIFNPFEWCVADTAPRCVHILSDDGRPPTRHVNPFCLWPTERCLLHWFNQAHQPARTMFIQSERAIHIANR